MSGFLLPRRSSSEEADQVSGFYQVRTFPIRTAKIAGEHDEVLLPDGWEPISVYVVGGTTYVAAKKRHTRRGRPARHLRIRSEA